MTDDTIPRTFNNLTKKEKWDKRYFDRKENKSIYWGQRKLLVMTLFFLTKYLSDGDTVIYIGASPGYNLKFITKLFPKTKWVLYDPREIMVKKNKNIKICNEYFNDETAREVAKRYNPKKLLIISDIRTFTDDYSVYNDLISQQKWVKIIKPKKAMLKFRLPFKLIKELNYLDGDLYLQPWTKPLSSETRLVTSASENNVIYNFKEYESKLFHFNTVERQSIYTTGNLTANYDFILEYTVIEEFINKFGFRDSVSWVQSKIDKLLKGNKCIYKYVLKSEE